MGSRGVLRPGRNALERAAQTCCLGLRLFLSDTRVLINREAPPVDAQTATPLLFITTHPGVLRRA